MEETAEPESSPMELFGLLYEKQNNAPLNREETAYLRTLMEKIWEDIT